jgi:outer membrane protein TolC
LAQNSGRNDFNPSKSINASLNVTQRLLQGFGKAVNNRNIRVSKNNIKVSELVFQQQVITTVSSVISLYWDLVSANEDVQVKRQALALNQKLYDDNKKQVEIGTLAPIEIIRAEAEVARSQQDLTISETNLLQQETVIKNALSRTGVASPGLAEAHIIPTDKIRMPETEPIEPIQDLVGKAVNGRPELEQARVNIESSKIGLKGSKNALLPSVDAFVDLRNNGLSGILNTQPIPPVPGAPVGVVSPPRNPANVDGFFLGGYGTALGQVFRRNFPDYSIGVSLNIPLRNRSAQADMVRDQLSLRQSEIRFQQSLNQVRVEVQNALISLQQARARYQTSVKNRVLQEQTLDAEQKKYALGASTIFFVIQAQRDLTAAQASEVAALSTYARARNELERATGQTLSANAIQIDEAMKGSVSKAPSAVPAVQ